MRRSLHVMMIAAAFAAGCSRQAPEQQTIDDAATALGGRDRILAVKTLVIEAQGSQGNLGQDMAPESTGQTFAVNEYRRSVDVAGRRARVELTRVPNFRYFAGQDPQKQVAGVDGDVAYNVGGNGSATRASEQVSRDRQAEFYHHPLTSVRAALEEGATLTNPRTEGGQDLVDVRTANGVTFTLAVDSATKLPARVISTSYNANLGDVIVETTFADYQDANGLRVPARLTTTTDGVMTADLTQARHTVDAQISDLAAPAAVASAAPITAPAPANVVEQQLAPGIWLLGGQSHHSVLVEFGDHLTLIEAPQNEVRTLGVIAKARQLVPGKPLTQLVVSHHHFDHSGGVRAAVAEGLTIIAHADAAAYLESAAKRPHTLAADALARNPKTVTVERVEGERVLTDGTMTVNLYAVTGNPHADTMLMAYFPRERLLVEADLFTPGAPVNPYAASLHENVTNRKLNVDRIVPLHGAVAPYGELVKYVQTQAGAATN